MWRREYGRLLLSVPVQKVIGQKSQAFAGWLYLGLGALFLFDGVRHRPHGADWALPVIAAGWIAWGVAWLWNSDRLRIYERGVLKPLRRDKQSRFLEWRQIERYYWEENTVFLAAGESLADGFQIHPNRRADVERLLATRLKATTPAASRRQPRLF